MDKVIIIIRNLVNQIIYKALIAFSTGQDYLKTITNLPFLATSNSIFRKIQTALSLQDLLLGLV